MEKTVLCTSKTVAMEAVVSVGWDEFIGEHVRSGTLSDWLGGYDLARNEGYIYLNTCEFYCALVATAWQ
ncbi:hypothetical protein BCS42_05700 [Crenothrix sp. D3]|jgi:hypothetical protein|nr:hypothetical protein BCS42_05700 [Crenothrix sp. D3]